MKTRKLTEEEVLDIGYQSRYHTPPSTFEKFKAEEIPVLENLDARIWNQIRGEPELLNMGNWHFNEGEDSDILIDEDGEEYEVDGEHESYDLKDSCDRRAVLLAAGQITSANDIEAVAEAAAEGFCGTSHCRAGWAIHLAGKAGYLLECKYGAELAGAAIYMVSTGSVPNFYASNREAYQDIRQAAGEEADDE